MDKRLGLSNLLEGESKSVQLFQRDFPEVTVGYEEALDDLLKLPYFVGNISKIPANAPQGALYSFCYYQYRQIPYTFWAIYQLCQRGHYYESLVLYRCVLEIFIQMRYFSKYPQKLYDHCMRTKPINFRTMFDEFSRDFYSDYYGKILSKFAHGGIGSIIFIVNHRSQSVIGECLYNFKNASSVVNYVVPILFGYLNFFETFFPYNTLCNDLQFYSKLQASKQWLQEYMKNHKRNNPQSLGLYKHLDRFIDVSIE